MMIPSCDSAKIGAEFRKIKFEARKALKKPGKSAQWSAAAAVTSQR